MRLDSRGTSRHHYYAKHENFDEYFYNSRMDESMKGADVRIIGGQAVIDYYDPLSREIFIQNSIKTTNGIINILDNVINSIAITDMA
ncbi:hypothetical protein KJ830_03830, partial [bacterium]|nr:hypothetical protein [bacterium]